MQVSTVQNYFLCSMSWIYLWAFSSLYCQIPEWKDLLDCTFTGDRPTALSLIKLLMRCSPQSAMELACVVGMVLAILSIVFRIFRDCIVYFVMWYLYFSCFQVGQTFLWFQWDTLLVETGFLTVLVAPSVPFRSLLGLRSLPHDRVTLFLVRWLVLRMMFASGVVKLTSECPTWWGLTALHYHFESQCIPTTLAWFAHQTSDWLKRLAVVKTYGIEILIPPLFLVPVLPLRKFAFFTQVFLMATIVVTGNYNFFNLVYCAICLPMLVDSSDSVLSTWMMRKKIGRLYDLGKAIVVGSTLGAVIYWSLHLFQIRLHFSSESHFEISSRLGFGKAAFYHTLAWSVPLLMAVGIALLISEIATALLRCWTDIRSKYRLKEVVSSMLCLFVCGFSSLMFAISLVPFSWLDAGANDMIWPKIKRWHATSDKFQLTHSYGLFRSMTGVGGRPELVLEGANSMDGPWKEYEFLYKPGNLHRPPPFVVPHQPRLDWQMWFAALGSYQHNPWFISLVYRVLRNDKEVLKLMDRNPFGGKAPKFVRAQLYLYHFTAWNTTNTRLLGFVKLMRQKETPRCCRATSRQWWWREWDREYMPAIDVDNPSVVNYLRSSGMIVEKRDRKDSRFRLLETLRGQVEKMHAPQFIWSLSATVLLLVAGKRALGIGAPI